MRKIFAIAVGVFLSLSLSAHAGSPAGNNISPPHDFLVKVQADLCGNWHRECARLWGYRSYNWQQCMGQPAAIYDCGGGGRGGGVAQPSGSLCENWYTECARLHGYRTQAWRQCMRQPAAIWDCQRGR